MSIQRPRGSLLKKTQLSSLAKFRSQLVDEQQQQPPQLNRGLSHATTTNNNRSNLVRNPQNKHNMSYTFGQQQQQQQQQPRNRNSWKSKQPLQNNTRNRNRNNNNMNNRYDNVSETSSNSGSSNAYNENSRLSRRNKNKTNNNNNNNKENIMHNNNKNRATRRRDTARSKSRTRNNSYKKPMTLNEAKEKVKIYRKQLNELNEVNERLNEEKQDLEDELHDIHERNSFDIQQKDVKINNLQSEKREILNENSLQKQQINEQQSQLGFKDNQLKMLESAKNSLQGQLNTFSQTIKMKDVMFENNKREMLSIKSQNNMLTQQTQQQSEKLFQLNNDLNQANSINDNQKQEIKKLRAENMTISLKNTSLNNMNESQLRKLRELSDINDKQKQEINFNYQRMERLKQENHNLNQHKAMLENENNQQSNTINQQQYEIKQLKEKCLWYEGKSRKDEEVRKKLHNQIQELKGNIRVYCRVRPLLNNRAGARPAGADEKQNGVYEFENDDIEKQEITLLTPSVISGISGQLQEGKKYNFNFDRVFRPYSDQECVFNEISQLVQSALDGYKVCIFAYGQTGSGKTYTMEGPSLRNDDIRRGMIPRSVEQIFKHGEKLREKGWQYECTATYLEIYNENIRDLLVDKKNRNSNSNYSSNNNNSYNFSNYHPSKNNNNNNNNNKPNFKCLEIKQRKNNKQNNKIEVYVDGLTEINVASSSDVYPLLSRASSNRSVGKTDCNERSSRSHSVFQLFLNGYNEITKQSTFGVLNLIDLAGSERLKKSNSTGIQLKETQNINKSLSCLGDVIAALSSRKNRSHIPYRNSKLTYLLMNCFGGDAKTLMFVNLCPEKDKIDESLCSLRFAAKVNDCQIGIAKRTVNN